MNANYDSHILRWKNVNWPVEEGRLLEQIRNCKGREVLARVRQNGKLVEVPSPNGDFTKRLQQGQINLRTGFELEVITREPAMVRAESPVEQTKPDDFIDQNDFNTLQWNGERGTGAISSSRVRNTPMFFRYNGMNADLVDLYAGQTLFLVLNGGSLAGFDWSRLKQPGICTFGINNGAHALRPTFWTSVDDPTRFLRSIWADPTITKFIPMSHFQKPIWDSARETFSTERVKDFPNVYGYRRNEAFQSSQWLFEDTINWGNHGKRGGGRSVMLAALRIAFLLGFRRVCLLGCDFYMDDNNRYWFEEQRSKNAVSNNQNSYRLMMGFFEELQPHFLAAGFHVVNCNPKSQLMTFPQADLETELRAATIDTSATTVGMYVDRYKDQKQAQQKKPGPQQQAPQARPVKPVPPTAPNPAVRTSPLPVHKSRRLEVRTLEHMLNVIKTTPVQHEPFAHLQLHSLIPEEIYREMLTHLPDDCHYHELRHADPKQPGGKSTRLRFGFSAKELGLLQGAQQKLWSQMRTVLHDPRLESALRTVLREGLRQRFGKQCDSMKLQPKPELVRDLSGYCSGVHTHALQQVLTVEFHLPPNDSQTTLGATYFRRNAAGTFDTVKKQGFTPCSGHALVVSDCSFIGLEVPVPPGQQRNSLTLTYHIK